MSIPGHSASACAFLEDNSYHGNTPTALPHHRNTQTPNPQLTQVQKSYQKQLLLIQASWDLYKLSIDTLADKIAPLTGKDYYRPLYRIMEIILNAHQLQNCLLSYYSFYKVDNEDVRAKLALLNVRCFNFLLNSIDQLLHHFLITHSHSQAIWKVIEDQFDPKNTTHIHSQFKELINITIKPNTSPIDYLITFENQ